MLNLNKAIVSGFIGNEVEVKQMDNKKSVCNLSIATKETWKKDGKPQERTEWHDVTFYGKLADIVGEHFKKGKPIYVEGINRTRKWKDAQKNDRYTKYIEATEMQML